MTPRRLHEYFITISVSVEALDEDQAHEIARDLRDRLKEASAWRLHMVEITDIEKVD